MKVPGKVPPRLLRHPVHGGFGIMLDDLLAGVFSAALLQMASRWLT